MTEYKDFEPFFKAMIGKMQMHDHHKGDSWKRDEKFIAHNLRNKLWEEFKECIEFNGIEMTANPGEFVDLANICAMLYLRCSTPKANQDE